MGWMTGVQFPEGIFLFTTMSRPALGHNKPPGKYWGVFLWKWNSESTKLTTPSSANDMNVWSFTPSFSCLHSVAFKTQEHFIPYLTQNTSNIAYFLHITTWSFKTLHYMVYCYSWEVHLSKMLVLLVLWD